MAKSYSHTTPNLNSFFVSNSFFFLSNRKPILKNLVTYIIINIIGHIWSQVVTSGKIPAPVETCEKIANDSMFKNKYITKNIYHIYAIYIHISTGCRISSQLMFHFFTLPRRPPWQLPGMPWYCPHCGGVSSRP